MGEFQSKQIYHFIKGTNNRVPLQIENRLFFYDNYKIYKQTNMCFTIRNPIIRVRNFIIFFSIESTFKRENVI